MRGRPLGYQDAVRLLGGDSRVASAVGRLVTAGLTAAPGAGPALGLFDLKDDVTSLGKDAADRVRRRVTGLGRFERSELLEAANAVLVVSAFFEALDDLDEELRTTLNTASLELTRAEQVALATGTGVPGSGGLAALVRAFTGSDPLPVRLLASGLQVENYYDHLASRVTDFAEGTAAWDAHDQTTRGRWRRSIKRDLPDRAVVRYRGRMSQLAGEFPEFAFWAHRLGQEAILDRLRDGTDVRSELRSLVALVTSAVSGTSPGKVRDDLVAAYRAQLPRPIVGAPDGALVDDVRVPSLQELYVNPSYRSSRTVWAGPGPAGMAEVTEADWRERPVRAGLWSMVLEHLISTVAARVPLVLLGQPGAGKSVFTQMLAAELDPAAYLVVRVELRAVPSDAGIQQQIEAALGNLTGRTMGWPELADRAGGAQPVILLDGFDEMLQASGVSHFDYLEKVREFQEREAGAGRPAAVIVTSRTAVAGQVRYPPGTAVARLEEFDDGQVGRWLAAWNRANPDRALPADVALAQGELVRQPLLLFLLALFHSGGGELTPGIGQAQLYQRLFDWYAERDVRKREPRLAGRQLSDEIHRELDRLSMVAFAMFNRGLRAVTEDDLADDLEALRPGHDRPGRSARADRLTVAEELAGRFFFKLFTHTDQARRGQGTRLSSFEFLHASLAEFLVARWIDTELGRLAELGRRAAHDLYPSPPDDAKLHALLSAAALSTREQRILDFAAGLFTARDAADLAGFRALVRTLFARCLLPREHQPFSGYGPAKGTGPRGYAVYSANLFLLLLVIAAAEAAVTAEPAREPVRVAELYPESGSGAEVAVRFRGTTRLWFAQLTDAEWASLVDAVRMDLPGPMSLSRQRPRDEWPRVSGGELLYGRALAAAERAGGLPTSEDRSAIWPRSATGFAFREASLLGAEGYRDACATVLPYLSLLGGVRLFRYDDIGLSSAEFLHLLITPGWATTARQRAAAYHHLLAFDLPARVARLLLDRLGGDGELLPAADYAMVAILAGRYAQAHVEAYLDVLAQVDARAGRPPEPPVSAVGLAAVGAFDVDRILAAVTALPSRRSRVWPAGLRQVLRRAGEHDLPEGAGAAIVIRLLRGGFLNLEDAPERLRDLLRGLGHPADADVEIEYRTVLPFTEMLTGLGAYEPDAVRSYLRPEMADRVLPVVVWAAMARRGLRAGALPVTALDDLVTGFPALVAVVRRLAAERGDAGPG